MTLSYDPPLKTADVSECGRYRYSLGRTWTPGLPTVVWCMLNPSVADASIDDPTIRRCIGFAKSWECGSIVVVNLFALRATDPKVLLTHPEPIGERNDEAIVKAIRLHNVWVVVCGWGSHRAARDRGPAVQAMMRAARGPARETVHAPTDTGGPPLRALALNRGLTPAHPLYQPNDAFLVPMPWPPA